MTASRQILEPEQKALEINLDNSIYGTFAEIGAGQEVARYFFQAGGAAGTIAKTMSAYDKVYSDHIYGVEASGRYVCENRLYKMLDHEYDLMLTRLRHERPDVNFFVFADTIAALNYQRTIKGDGWLGLRFQVQPDGEANDLVLHVRMLDNDNRLQQQAIGVLGVNMVYACFRYYHNPEMLVRSLTDHLQGRVAIDLLRLSGPAFSHVDNRLIALLLVKHGLTEVTMFGPDGNPVHASETLYKKSALLVRGGFRPPTLVNADMIRSSWEQFRTDSRVQTGKAVLLTEMTLDTLQFSGTLDEQDFLHRAELLGAMGHTVVLSQTNDHRPLLHYFSEYKIPLLGLVMGARELLNLVNHKYYQHQDGSLLAAFGELFRSGTRFYIYPFMQEGSAELMTCDNLPVPEGIKFLYRHLLDSGHIQAIEGYHSEHLHLFSHEVLQLIRKDTGHWEQMVPPKVAQVIKTQHLFGYPCEKMEFEY